jgi:hypothetical protein
MSRRIRWRNVATGLGVGIVVVVVVFFLLPWEKLWRPSSPLRPEVGAWLTDRDGVPLLADEDLDERFVFDVLPEHRAEAMRLLEVDELVLLSDQQAIQFSGRSPCSDGRQPFLVRSVRYPFGDKSSVYYGSGQLLIVSKVGRLLEPCERMPLVVYLTERPERALVMLHVPCRH